MQSYYIEIDNFVKHTDPSLMYLANQVEKNENKFPRKVYDIVLSRLASSTCTHLVSSSVYFKLWLETDKDIEEIGTAPEEMPADATPEQIRQSVESECA